MNNWVTYKNGNYTVHLNLEDGTKIRENDLDNLTPAFAENMDVTLTKKCSQNCSFCYEGCSPEGKHSDIMNQKWIHTLHPYTELALNGNDMDHPQLFELLDFLKEKKVITNITLNQNQFLANYNLLKTLITQKLIYGLGVSLIEPTEEFINKIKEFPTAVIHTIAGITTVRDYIDLQDDGLKVLILGYKKLSRGNDYYTSNDTTVEKNMKELIDVLPSMISSIWFDVVSFDNLALTQLDVKSMLPEERWETFYMGDDGGYTFYLDSVNETFSRNSVAAEDKRYALLDSVDDMFNYIRKQEQ